MPDFTFDEETHTYRVDGVVVPSINQVLEAENFKNTAHYDEWYATRGKFVHQACHYLVHDILDWDSLDPQIEGYVRAADQFIKDTRPYIYLSEEPMCVLSPYKFAGTPDWFALINKKPAVIDIKCGVIEPWMGLQFAPQELLWRDGFDRQGHTYSRLIKGKILRFTLQLKLNGKYNLVPFTGISDKGVFLSALACYNWKRNHKK